MGINVVDQSNSTILGSLEIRSSASFAEKVEKLAINVFFKEKVNFEWSTSRELGIFGADQSFLRFYS